MSAKLKIGGFNKLLRIAERFPHIAEKWVGKAISRTLVRILGAEKVEAPFGTTGNLRDNWQIDTGRFTGRLFSRAPYALFVHEGTRPHFPPVGELTPWAQKRGINPWALARSIASRGTKANPFLQRAVDSTKPSIEGEFKDALEGILKEAVSLGDTL